MVQVQDLTKQVIGKKVRVVGEEGLVESRVVGIDFNETSGTGISFKNPLGRINFVLRLENDVEIEILEG